MIASKILGIGVPAFCHTDLAFWAADFQLVAFLLRSVDVDDKKKEKGEACCEVEWHPKKQSENRKGEDKNSQFWEGRCGATIFKPVSNLV